MDPLFVTTSDHSDDLIVAHGAPPEQGPPQPTLPNICWPAPAPLLRLAQVGAQGSRTCTGQPSAQPASSSVPAPVQCGIPVPSHRHQFRSYRDLLWVKEKR